MQALRWIDLGRSRNQLLTMTTRPAYRVARRFGEIWIETMRNGVWVPAEPGCPSYATLEQASEAMGQLMDKEEQ